MNKKKLKRRIKELEMALDVADGNLESFESHEACLRLQRDRARAEARKLRDLCWSLWNDIPDRTERVPLLMFERPSENFGITLDGVRNKRQ